MLDDNGDELELLTQEEVALRFRVDPKTITRWARDGRLQSIRTPGAHYRFNKKYIDDLFADWRFE